MRGIDAAAFAFAFALPTAGCSTSRPAESSFNVEAHRSPTDVALEADRLVAQGQFANALDAYIWCLDQGLRVDAEFEGVHDRVLPARLAELGHKYAPAAQALEQRLSQTEKMVRAGQVVNDADIAVFGTANRHLGKPQRTLELYFVLSKSNNPTSARALFTEVLPMLLERHLYREVVEPGFLAEDFAGAQRGIDSLERYRFELGKQLVEALAGAHRNDEALQVVHSLTKTNSDAASFLALAQSAMQAGNAPLTRTIVALARAAVPSDQAAALDDFARGLPTGP